MLKVGLSGGKVGLVVLTIRFPGPESCIYAKLLVVDEV